MGHSTIRILLTVGFSLTLFAGVAACAGDPGTGPGGAASSPPRPEPPAVYGVPAGFAADGDARTVAAREPHVANMPDTGQSVAYLRPAEGPAGVWRIVVVLNPDQAPLLAGREVTPPADWPGRGHQLVSDGNTLYVISNTPGGNHWFLAVTGGSGADRFAAARDIVARTLNGP
jgi:hypothetical protein